MWSRKAKVKWIVTVPCVLVVVWYWYDAATRMSGYYVGKACAVNLHRIYSGLALYAQDYDQQLPIASVWMDRTKDHLQSDRRPLSVFHCPAVSQGSQAFGYGFNRVLSSAPINRYPSETVLVFDSQNTHWNANSDPVLVAYPVRHERKWPKPMDNAVCIDGHMRRIRTIDIFPLASGGATIKANSADLLKLSGR